MAVIAPIVSTWDPRGVNKAQRDLDGFADRSGRAFGAIASAAKLAAAAVAGIAVGAAVGIGKAVNAASDLEEATAKVTQIFGADATRAIEGFADTAATAFGQSRQSVLDAAGVFGTFGKAAGLGGNDLADFATGFTGLASDLASFNNTTPQEAIEAIGAALRGESEPLRRYGVLLDDATLRQKALELGIYDGTGALDQRQKILAAEAVIWEQTADAQSDFARTSDGLANQSRILKAQLANVVAELGRKFLPIATKLAQFVNDRVVPVIERLAETFSKDGLRGVLAELGDWIRAALPPALAKLGDLVRRLGDWLVSTGLPLLGQKAQQLGQALIDWIGPRIGPALAKLGELLAQLGNWIIDTGVPLLVDKLVQLGNALVDWIGPRIGPALEALGRFLGSLLTWVVTEAVPKLAAQSLKLTGALLSWLAKLLPDALIGLGRFVVSLAGAIPGIFTRAVSAIFDAGKSLGSKLIEGLKSGFTGLITAGANLAGQLRDAIVSALKSGWNNAIAGPVNSAVRTAVNALDTALGPFVNFPDPPNIVPRLARGGIVSSPTLALIGDRTLSGGTQNREAVVPLDRLDNGGPTIIVQGAIDPVATARQIRRILNVDATRRGAPVVLT